MSWSVYVFDEAGNDLFDEYGVQPDLLGLGESLYIGSVYEVRALRSIVEDAVYADRYPEPAQDAFKAMQACVRANRDYHTPHHCPTCVCPAADPVNRIVERCDRFLNIPVDRVHRIVVNR